MSKLILLVTREGLGHVDLSDKQFGLEMFDRLLHAWESQPVKPHAICFYTDGVKLVCKGSPALLGLKILHSQGVRLISCRTCLEHFQLTEKVAVGEVGGMNDIVGLLVEADSVVTV
jgi:intracellular sulfur oxidation DsrE/DsrF family protein